MKAWFFDVHSHRLELRDRPETEPRRGAVQVRIEAASVLSFMSELLAGERGSDFPVRDFVPGTDAVGTVTGVGEGVYHLTEGQRVSLGPHLVADEPVPERAQSLLGHMTRFGPKSLALQFDWVDGTFAESVEWPARRATPLDPLGDVSANEALGLAKCSVPYGGLRRIGVCAGEVVAINGASGFYGSAGVFVALAMGACRVLALGRDQGTLAAIAQLAGSRVVPVVMSGEPQDDIRALRNASGGAGVDAALDMIGAKSASTTGSVLRALRRGGRLAMMGSCPEPLRIDFAEMLANDWLIAGQFMYSSDAQAELIRLAASGQLPLTVMNVEQFGLEQLPEALKAASAMRGLDLTAVVPD